MARYDDIPWAEPWPCGGRPVLRAANRHPETIAEIAEAAGEDPDRCSWCGTGRREYPGHPPAEECERRATREADERMGDAAACLTDERP